MCRRFTTTWLNNKYLIYSKRLGDFPQAFFIIQNRPAELNSNMNQVVRGDKCKVLLKTQNTCG